MHLSSFNFQVFSPLLYIQRKNDFQINNNLNKKGSHYKYPPFTDLISLMDIC